MRNAKWRDEPETFVNTAESALAAHHRHWLACVAAAPASAAAAYAPSRRHQPRCIIASQHMGTERLSLEWRWLIVRREGRRLVTNLEAVASAVRARYELVCEMTPVDLFLLPARR